MVEKFNKLCSWILTVDASVLYPQSPWSKTTWTTTSVNTTTSPAVVSLFWILTLKFKQPFKHLRKNKCSEHARIRNWRTSEGKALFQPKRALEEQKMSRIGVLKQVTKLLPINISRVESNGWMTQGSFLCSYAGGGDHCCIWTGLQSPGKQSVVQLGSWHTWMTNDDKWYHRGVFGNGVGSHTAAASVCTSAQIS